MLHGWDIRLSKARSFFPPLLSVRVAPRARGQQTEQPGGELPWEEGAGPIG